MEFSLQRTTVPLYFFIPWIDSPSSGDTLNSFTAGHAVLEDGVIIVPLAVLTRLEKKTELLALGALAHQTLFFSNSRYLQVGISGDDAPFMTTVELTVVLHASLFPLEHQ